MWALTQENLSLSLQTTKVQTSLCICAVWSAPVLFAYWKVSYLHLLQANFSFFKLVSVAEPCFVGNLKDRFYYAGAYVCV